VPELLHRTAAVMLAPGGRVHLAPVAAADPADPEMTVPRHDPAALADALGVVLAELDGGSDGTGFDTQTRSAPRGQETRRSNAWR
jgi:hypothetical protein